MDEQFTSYEPLLWGVLSRLARDGYVAPPNDARDLIQDFYADEWRGLVERHDPERGSPTAYVAGAFYRFARRRIFKLQTWRSRLADVKDLERHPDPSTDQRAQRDEFLWEERLARVRAASDSFLRFHGKYCVRSLKQRRAVERDLARRFGSRAMVLEVRIERARSSRNPTRAGVAVRHNRWSGRVGPLGGRAVGARHCCVARPPGCRGPCRPPAKRRETPWIDPISSAYQTTARD